MYNISDDYKIACKELTRQSRSKVVIDNITYDGSKYIKDYPKFSHSNETMIGGFPIRSAEFSLWIKTGSIEIVDKEIKIYRGLLINEKIEWIPQGVFYADAEDVTTSDTGEYITVKCYDKAKEAGTKKYVDNNTYPISETNYIKNVISQSGYELDESFFVESDYIMTQKPNMPENTSVREIISRYAEQRGAIALFSRLGKVQIKRPTEVDFLYIFYEYKKLTCESTYGPLNQIILGNKNINNNVVWPAEEKSFPWIINDNPFLDLLKLDRNQEIYNQIKNLEMTPFTLESTLDVFYLDINDIITIEKKDKTLQKVTILSIETENRLKCKIGASVQDKNSIDYELAGSVKKELETVRFDVDYNKQKINALVSTTTDHEERIVQNTMDINGIKQTISNTYNFTREASANNKLVIENAQEGNLIELHITGEMSLLYPDEDLYPSDDLYPLDSYLNIENSEGEIRQVLLPITHLYKIDDISDEFILKRIYNEDLKKYESKCKIIKRVGIKDNKIHVNDDLSSLKISFINKKVNLDNLNMAILFRSSKYTVIESKLVNHVIELQEKGTDNSIVLATITDDKYSYEFELPDDFGIVTGISSDALLSQLEVKSIRKYLLASEEIQDYEDLDISLWEGTNKIYLESFQKMNYSCKYAIINEITDKYTTKVELNSAIEQTETSITESVSALIENLDIDLSAKIELKIDLENLVSSLNASADEINIEGNRIRIKSQYFELTKEGKITATGGKVGGFNITDTTLWCEIKPPYDYSTLDIERIRQIMLGKITATAEDMSKYDYDKNGILNSADLLRCRQFVVYGVGKSTPGKLLFDATDWFAPIKIINSNGQLISSFGPTGVYTAPLPD